MYIIYITIQFVYPWCLTLYMCRSCVPVVSSSV